MVNWIFPCRHASGPRFQTTRIHPLSPDPTFVEIIWHIDASAMSEDFFHTPTQAKNMATLPSPFTLSVIFKCVDMSVNPSNDTTPKTSSSNSIPPSWGPQRQTPFDSRQSSPPLSTRRSSPVSGGRTISLIVLPPKTGEQFSPYSRKA